MSEQLSFLPEIQQKERPRKSVRKVSRANLYHLKDSGALSERVTTVLNALAHHYYVTQRWPTVAELTRWMFRHGRIPRESTNVVAPRISGLVNGEWSSRTTADGRVERVRLDGGSCELLPKRVCAVTGGMAHPIRIREAGSVLARFGYVGR